MVVKYKNTEQDSFLFYKLYLKYSIKQNSIIFLFISVAMGLVLQNKSFNWVNFTVTSFVTFLILFIFKIYLPYRKNLTVLKSKIDEEIDFLGEKTLKIEDDGLLFESSSNSNFVNWESILRIKVIQDYVVIITNKNNAFFFNKKSFSTHEEFTEFVNLISNKIELMRKTKPPYKLGYLLFLPVIGLIVGLIMIVLSIFHYKDKKLALVGLGGVLFTVILYIILFDWSDKIFTNKDENTKQIVVKQLDKLKAEIISYQLKNKEYPQRLADLIEDNPQTWIIDPFTQYKTEFYYVKTDSSFILCSVGKDGLKNTNDDIFPAAKRRDEMR